jgi:outer membrane protein OmpA-like peptidoglycan-associated protein
VTRRRVALVALALLAAGSGACGGSKSDDEPSASVTTVAVAPTSPAATTGGTPRPGMPTVPTVDERTIPRASVKEAVIEGRPAVIVTLPETVLFDVGEAVLRTDAEPSLQGVVDLVGTRPGATTEVQGHTDSTGSAAFNQSLSERRAAAVADWLAGHGVARSTLTTAGYGATRPVADNATEAGRQANRRVEIVVTSPAG